MDPSFRFLHAGDLHLECPPAGLAELPDHLRGALVDGAFRASERVFDAALKHRVDFVLLAGDILDPQAAGPRGIVFLNEQFQKLHDARIEVYWAGSPLDHFRTWADLWPLPDNVHRLAVEHVERVVHYRGGEPLVQILGTSGQAGSQVAADAYVAAEELFAVAVAHGQVAAERLARQFIAYWALGGEHSRRSLLGGTVTAHYCGTPQGRSFDEAGPHGCTLVQVDDTQRIRTTFLPTDAVRYLHERLVLEPDATLAQIPRLLAERTAELLIDPFGPDLVIHWTLAAAPPLAAAIRAGHHADAWLAELRGQHGDKRPAAWSVRMEIEGAEPAAGLLDEDTLLGEFLRAARQAADHADEPLELAEYLSERQLAGSLAPLASLSDTSTRRGVLAEVAALGVELLRAPEARS